MHEHREIDDRHDSEPELEMNERCTRDAVIARPTDTAPPIRGILTGLANLPADTLVCQEALAALLGCTARTVRRMVGRGELPRPAKLGNRRVWIVGRVLEWVHAASERAESEQQTEQKRIERMRGA